MSDIEPDLQHLEREFVRRSGSAFAAARQQALAKGLKVMHVEGSSVMQVAPDGTRVKVKDIPERKPAPAVRTIQLR